MSSAAYEAGLVPARHLRTALLAAAGGALLAGIVLVVCMPAAPLLKAGLCLLWVLSCGGEVSSFRRGMSRIDRIGIRDDGSVLGYGPDGARHVLRLLPGSVVLERVAWLRLGFGDGLAYGELVTGDAAESEAWRRLLVIWRQRGTFGRSGRS